MKKLTVDKPKDLKSFLSEKLSISKGKAKKLIDSKNVLVNSKRVWIATHMLSVGDVVEVPEAGMETEKIQKDISIIYEDDFIVAVNKPPFLVSESKRGSVEDILRKKKGKSIKAIHRLDMETSGVLLFAKSWSVFERFKKLWEDKKVKKLYIAIAHKRADFKKKVVNFSIDGKIAKSTIYTKKTAFDFSLFEVDIKTGRKHQIRIHLSKIGHPIVGDKIYGYKTVNDPLLKQVKRHMLHAKSIEFFHPFLKKKIKIDAPLFEDFKALAKKLNLS